MRPYLPGDDVRLLEWNVTARTGIPHVRVNLAERVLVTWLLLDVSPSMRFGTAERRKCDVAAGVAEIEYWAERDPNLVAVYLSPQAPGGKLLDNPDQSEELPSGRLRRRWYRQTIWDYADGRPLRHSTGRPVGLSASPAPRIKNCSGTSVCYNRRGNGVSIVAMSRPSTCSDSMPATWKKARLVRVTLPCTSSSTIASSMKSIA